MLNDKPQTAKYLDHLDTLIYAALIVTLSWLVINAHILTGPMNHNWQARLPDMLTGAAYQPFVYRTLTAQLVRLAAPIIPADLGPAWARENAGFREIFLLLEGHTYPQAALGMIVVQWASLAVAALALRALMRQVGIPAQRADLLTLAFLPSVLIFAGLAYIYDLPIMALWLLALLALAKEKWNLYMILFALANIQKETSALLVLVFAVWAWKRAPFYWLLLADQIGIALLTKLLMTWLFLGNPGVPLDLSITPNRNLAARYPLSLAFSLALYALAAWRIARRWGRLPLFARQALIVLPPLVILWLIGGRLNEIRVFLEIWPIIFILLGV